MLNNTQFLDLMKSYMKPEAYMNSIKNMPGIDLSSIAGIMQKAMNIFTTTNQIATESMQAVLKKNSELLQSNINNALNTAKEVMESGDIKHATECHHKCMKLMYDNSMHHAKEYANLAHEASAKIVAAVNKNVSEASHNASANVHDMAENAQKNTFNKKPA